MASGLEEELFDAAVLALRDFVGASPSGTRRMLLKSLLQKCGYKAKTQERLSKIQSALAGVDLLTEPPLVDCDRDTWITISKLEPTPATPAHPWADDPWFLEVAGKSFASEKEVEIRFLIPLLDRLGYTEEDRADGFPIEITVGTKRTRAEADFVLFNGKNRSMDNALMVVEAKRSGKRLSDHISQARSYAMFLGTPFYLLSNGDDILVFEYRSPVEADRIIFEGTRQHLLEQFHTLHGLIQKGKADARKAQLRMIWRGNS